MKTFEISEFCGYEVAVEVEEKNSYGIITISYDLETENFSKDFYDCNFGKGLRAMVLKETNLALRFALGEAFQQMILGYYAQFKDEGVIAFTPENGEGVIVRIPEKVFEK